MSSAAGARWGGCLLACVGGLLQAGSIAWPWNGQPLWWLQLLSLGLLAALWQRASSWRGAALTGWLFGLGWLAGTFWWLFISMHVYGGLAVPLAAGGVLGLAAFLALYYALAGGLFAWLRRGHPLADAVLFAAAWLLAELLRASWFTGFPWGAAGYAHVDGPLAVLAPWIGVYGIGAVAAGLAYALALLLRPVTWRSGRYWAAIGGAVGLLAACNAAGPAAPGASAAAQPPLAVALLQGNIPQDEKFEPGSGVPLALQWYGRALMEIEAPLIVAPETAIPLLPKQLPPDYMPILAERFAQGERAALVGVPLGSYEAGYTNSVIALQPSGAPYRYDKHHLVPFGEFIPPLFRWFTDLMNIPLGDFHRGDVGQASFVWRGQRLAPNICYEDLFGEELAARFADPATAPTILVNVSNIGWFGNTVAIDQHLHISRMRAKEFARPMLRATNTGATAIIDRHGTVTHLLPRYTRDVLRGEVEGGLGITPYAWWMARLGLWPLWAAALGGLVLAWVARRRRGAAYNQGLGGPPARA